LVISRPSMGAQILGVLGPSCGIPGPCGPLYSEAESAAADGNTAAADKAAAEQRPFIRLLREKFRLIKDFLQATKNTLHPACSNRTGPLCRSMLSIL
jgi:hypothetical protein